MQGMNIWWQIILFFSKQITSPPTVEANCRDPLTLGQVWADDKGPNSSYQYSPLFYRYTPLYDKCGGREELSNAMCKLSEYCLKKYLQCGLIQGYLTRLYNPQQPIALLLLSLLVWASSAFCVCVVRRRPSCQWCSCPCGN